MTSVPIWRPAFLLPCDTIQMLAPSEVIDHRNGWQCPCPPSRVVGIDSAAAPDFRLDISRFDGVT